MNNNNVILVDKYDNPLGEMEKMEAHITGKLHRAFSIFIFNEKKEILIHQRSEKRYHGAGLWSNACCSHPGWNEHIETSALNRLYYELGLKCPIKKIFTFTYRKKVENNLIENEFDHVFIGFTNQKPQPNGHEVKAFKWVTTEWLQKNITSYPGLYTSWFKLALPKVLSFLNETT